MTTCDHQVKFHVKQLVARMPEYKCKHCGATVMMGKRLKNAIQAINVVFIIIMIAAAISSSILGPGMVGFVSDTDGRNSVPVPDHQCRYDHEGKVY